MTNNSAIKNDKTLADELAEQFDMHSNQIYRMEAQLQASAINAFGGN